jgi:hypothetical protein
MTRTATADAPSRDDVVDRESVMEDGDSAGVEPAAARTRSGRARPVVALVGAAVLVVFGVASVARGLEGRATVRDALAQEGVVGSPHMTPSAIAGKAREAGLRDVALPTCSVAGKPVEDGAAARCFAEYMRVDALMGTRGATYAQMPRFATADGKGTDDPAQAQRDASGRPVSNPARNVWVTETALSNALNTSYMAEQVSLFGIAVGAAFLLVGAAFAGIAIGGLRRRRPSLAMGRAAGPG